MSHVAPITLVYPPTALRSLRLVVADEFLPAPADPGDPVPLTTGDFTPLTTGDGTPLTTG